MPQSTDEVSANAALLQHHAYAILTSILPDAPSQSEIKNLAQSLHMVQSSFPHFSFDLDPLYTPPTTVVNNWIGGMPSNERQQKFIRPPRDAVRDRVNTTNSSDR